MKRRGAWRRVTIGLGMVVAALWSWSLVSWLTAPVRVPPRLPNPNGYDDVLRAARTIGALRPLDFRTADAETLRAVVEPNREALATVRVGLGRPFQVPFVTDMNDLMTRQNEGVTVIRLNLTPVLQAEGTLAEREGRFDDALRSYLDTLRLGDAMSRGVTMILYQASLAVEYRGLAALRDLRPTLNAAQCRTLIAALESSNAAREPAAAVARREHDFMDSNLRKMGMPARLSYSLTGLLRREKNAVSTQLAADEKRSDVRRRVLLAEVAVRLEILERGKPPASLDALVPKVLRAVPVDPFGGLPLVYRTTADGYQLYSRGPDGDDDHLDPPLGRRHGATSNGDFTIDSF